MKKPYVIISTAMSLDGFIDDTSSQRLRISNDKDFARVDKLRDSCDAILVGATTIRKDNPKLLSKSGQRLTKVTLTSSGNLDVAANFFTTGESEKIVYTTSLHIGKLKEKLSSGAIIESGGKEKIDLEIVLEDLSRRGIKRLMVEGGSSILTQFLQEGLVDEVQIAIGGFFVGQKGAPRFVTDGIFPQDVNNRMHLDSVEKLDDIVVLIYKV
jgi:5-amino-6-(5-phosphoribosylamino)uracil reductase